MPKTYRPYDVDYDVPYIGRTGVIKNYLDKKFSSISVDQDAINNTVRTSVTESLGNINCNFCSIHNHIDSAKQELLDKGNNMVSEINAHTDEKFNEIDFIKQFSDLNEQIASLKNN